jgi:predicted metal-dependent phosphoesterase TrpH
MIDLHTHTTESDGTFRPEELVREAKQVGLEALAITDHDTFTGYEIARPCAVQQGLELVCGIELATKFHGHAVHLLAYFLNDPPGEGFRRWVVTLQEGRRRRNQELIEKLNAAGMPVTIEELEQRGRKLIVRPHFAAVMLAKGYVQSLDEAFGKYLDESGSCYVPMESPEFAEAVAEISNGGGISVLPHPVRINVTDGELETMVGEMRGLGLNGIEVYHSDHDARHREFYRSVAERFGLKISGGSDFHGAHKPRVALGSGIGGNVRVPYEVLRQLRG